MSFFKSLFGKTLPPSRVIRHPRELRIGDIICLDNDFGLPMQLRGQSLEVMAVNTYEFERSQLCEWQLKGAGNDSLFLSVSDDDEPGVHFSLKLNRTEVEGLFDMDAFAEIFEEGHHAQLSTSQSELLPARLEQWLGNQYHQVTFAQFGYFHRQDYRGLTPPQDSQGACGEPFERYALEDDSQRFTLELEVFEGGDTDVLVGIHCPLDIIREYWPASATGTAT